MKGTFIVIDGIDGAGKATQTALLVRRLKRNRIPVRTIDFPRYDTNHFGRLIAECLRGEHGDFIGLDPRITSVLFAADRFESKRTIDRWLAKGHVVIADRFVSSNQIHQGAKIRDAKAARAFLEWLERMEYGVFGLPRPDAIIYLDLPADLSATLLEKAVGKKSYLQGKRDAAEADRAHQENARKAALSMVKKANRWETVSCARRGKIRPIAEIHDEVAEIASRYLRRTLR